MRLVGIGRLMMTLDRWGVPFYLYFGLDYLAILDGPVWHKLLGVGDGL